ncbi:uncharacterized protein LOC112130126 isoform X3 [Pongo abelii]|uniref:uncharacterized protein LOC112130126 isoform X3 n=1 Tax=Pongo abelii TaxID=9601 RepID=UPI003004C62D
MSERINAQEARCYRTDRHKARIHRADSKRVPFPSRPRSPLARAGPLPGLSGRRGGLSLGGPRGPSSGPSPALPRAAGVVGAGGRICAWSRVSVGVTHRPRPASASTRRGLREARTRARDAWNAPRAAFHVLLGFWSFPPSSSNWICEHDELCFPELVLCLLFWPHLTEQHIKATEHQEGCCLGKFCEKSPGGLGAGQALLSLSWRLGRASRRLPGSQATLGEPYWKQQGLGPEGPGLCPLQGSS